MIWFKKYTLDFINSFGKNNMLTHIGIEFNAIGDNYLQAKLPVDSRTTQPAGLLHGGATAALAETIGSVGAFLTIDPEKYVSVGIELNINHIKSKKKGNVIGTGRPIHLGNKTQVWEIKIEDEHKNLISVSRITLAILAKQ